jgi:hypothetical protein
MGVPVEKIRLFVVLEGEAAMRLSMWAEQQGMQKNLAAKKMLIAGMKDMGLLLKIYEG